ncbi:homeobox protein Hox-B4-like [Tupaia chinensis]|uniref:homeobox protein Hox-B4-like n=1 Tax=Tupaia chinensis TaxID=246437 RepID=UPI000703DD1F|nr:homeobox protein Hox-B4-like [Tupaia chinensis]
MGGCPRSQRRQWRSQSPVPFGATPGVLTLSGQDVGPLRSPPPARMRAQRPGSPAPPSDEAGISSPVAPGAGVSAPPQGRRSRDVTASLRPPPPPPIPDSANESLRSPSQCACSELTWLPLVCKSWGWSWHCWGG